MPQNYLQQESLPAASLDLSVVVPCHNECQALPFLLPRLEAACKTVTEKFEIILVNDGSTDATWPAMVEASRTRPLLVALNLARRYGQQIALSAGLSRCRGKRILIIDADLQDPPELLPDMMKRMDAGADVVYGQRRSCAGESWFKKCCARLFYRFMRVASDSPLPVDAGDFRLINRRVWEMLQQMPERHRYLRGMIAWIGLQQEPLLYDRAARKTGQTHYPLFRMLRLAMDGITSFSTFPLRLSFWVSVICAALALVLILYAVGAWFLNDTITGWTSIVCIILFFFSLQFFCIGMIGEYVGRIYMESKHRPLFIIQQSTNDSQS